MSTTVFTSKHGVSADRFGRVGVLMGGCSAERDISLKSGEAVLRGLLASGVNACSIDIGDQPVQQLMNANIDRAFIALHGPGGEDGKIQALLSFLNIPFTGSGMAPSSLAMNKLKSKLVWQGLGLPTPKFEVINSDSNFNEVLTRLGGACFVKPATEGSSFGMRLVDTAQELSSAYSFAASFDQEVIAESKISGREFTVAVLNNEALPVIELKTENAFYDYDAKYVSGSTRYLCPAELDVNKTQEIKDLALEAFDSLSCISWGRVDFMQDENEDFYLLEANTVPGMTDHSLVPKAASAAGLSFNDLLLEILAGSL